MTGLRGRLTRLVHDKDQGGQCVKTCWCRVLVRVADERAGAGVSR